MKDGEAAEAGVEDAYGEGVLVGRHFWLLVDGCWLMGVGCWLMGVGCWLMGVSCWLVGVSCGLGWLRRVVRGWA